MTFIELIITLKELAFFVLLVALIVAVPKIAEAQRKMGDSAADIRLLLQKHWSEPVDKSVNSPWNLAYQILFAEFMMKNPELKDSSKEAKGAAFANWLKNRQKESL